jgi:Skp family chaperone for outer membrane proteins
MKKIIKGMLVLVFVLFFTGLDLFAKDIKIAYIDLNKVSSAYKKTNIVEKRLEKKATEARGEIYKKRIEIETLKEKLKEMEDSEGLYKPEVKLKKKKELKEKIWDYEKYVREAEERLQEEKIKLIKEIRGDVIKAVTNYAKDNNIDYILEKRTIYYGEGSSDVSKEIIKILNANFAITSKSDESEELK